MTPKVTATVPLHHYSIYNLNLPNYRDRGMDSNTALFEMVWWEELIEGESSSPHDGARCDKMTKPK